MIYLDNDFKCHVSNDGEMLAYETDFFDGKCPTYIEGYRYVPEGYVWITDDGIKIEGGLITPWVDYSVIERAQFEYEHELLGQLKAQNAEYETALIEIEQALEV